MCPAASELQEHADGVAAGGDGVCTRLSLRISRSVKNDCTVAATAVMTGVPSLRCRRPRRDPTRGVGRVAVIATVSSSVKADRPGPPAGADHVINYPTDDVEARMREIAPGGAERIVELTSQPISPLTWTW